MIPFYKERIEFIDQQIDEYNHPESNATKEEKTFLKNSKNEIQRSLDKEIADVKRMAETMYLKWKEILDLREQQEYQASNVNLKIYKTVQENGDIDYNFDNTPSVPDEKFLRDGRRPLPGAEKDRRNDIKAL